MQIDIMHYRYNALAQTIDGLNKSNVDMVAYDGANFYASGRFDDPGLYYVIPLISHTFGISLDSALYLFFKWTLMASFLVGIIGIFLAFRKPLQRIVGILVYGYGYMLVSGVRDVYLIPFVMVIAIVPYVIYFQNLYENTPAESQGRMLRTGLHVFAFLSGILMGIGQLIRYQSATMIIIFFVILLILGKNYLLKTKFIAMICLVAGLMIPSLFLQHVQNKRDAFLTKTIPGYTTTFLQHPVWHSVYIGFGFLNNKYGIRYEDEVAKAKVQSVAPGTPYCSAEYSEVLKHEVFNLIRSDRSFVIATIAAKTGVLAYLFLRFGLFGLLTTLYYKKPFPVNPAYLAAMLIGAAPGIVVMPLIHYLLGFIAFILVFDIHSINYALEKGLLSDIKNRLSRK